ncbi:hypothetical protein BJ684DRAFT_10548 [Piptocephalis cylindrospora]|uniref:DUF202 domain-containing protein n=1 Tax=Piptocephalis cylindrospora TaxID=1907219 RepID=A0A4P9Y2L1_9FUNG|nr:hypothetical protein BJ684DRAFT_10548 [Piptocephalis cylindrospora]|eukprot:RKP13087.1 hypothetical protein BJ684DRAFT_10548 [Piptocephalis cylindrospora]
MPPIQEHLPVPHIGSAARDHLGLERTFMSWIRLSFSLSAVGGLLILNFRFPLANNPEDGGTTQSDAAAVSSSGRLPPTTHAARAAGVAAIAIGCVTLLLALWRYLRMQSLLVRFRRPLNEDSTGIWSLGLVCAMAFGYSIAALVWEGSRNQ